MRHEQWISLQKLAFKALLLAFSCFIWLGSTADAQSNPFAGGWTLQPKMSNLDFQSVKKQTVVETSSFAVVEGFIDESGLTQIKVLLDSVDTNVDLRNVRMRFLFFETFKFPETGISTQLDPAALTDLEKVRRMQLPVVYTLSLHGVTKSFEAELKVTLLGEDLVSVASQTPISVKVSDFNLQDGLGKLQEAANVDIVPSASVSFDFVFARNTPSTTTQATSQVVEPVKSVALEAEGDFDLKACKGRFEILSRSGEIYFTSGSARLEDKSAPLLNALAAIVLRCPGMVIEAGGHTDSVGDAAANQRLSEARAASVVKYLLGQGLNPNMIVSKGYGETEPIATNETKKGRWKNRRIGFKVL
jgi:OOP family OmpA-OmpF porin